MNRNQVFYVEGEQEQPPYINPIKSLLRYLPPALTIPEEGKI